MDEFAVRGARLTPYQKIVLIGVRPDAVEPLLDRLDAIGLSARPSQWRQNTMACTGIEFCKLAIVDTKNRARDLVAELEQRFPDLDTPITVNVNGCRTPARTQVADIGLKGSSCSTTRATRSRASRCTWGRHQARRELRPQAARAQGDQRGAGRLRDRRRDGVPRRARGRRVVRHLGRPRRRAGPPRRARAGRASHEPPRSPSTAHTAATRTSSPRGRLGVPVVPAGVRGHLPRPGRAPRRRRSARPTDHETTQQARDFRGTHTAGRSPEELRDLVSHVGAELELAPAENIIEWAVATFGDRFCITSSMGDAVLAHLASVAPGIDVVFLDTGYHFVETIGTRDAVEATLPVNLLTSAGQSVAEQDAAYGKDLYKTDPDLCCNCARSSRCRHRWPGTTRGRPARVRAETHNRVIAPVVGWDARKGKVKVSPLARWTTTTSSATSPTTTSWSTRWSTTATRRSAALRARGGSPRRRPAQQSLGGYQQDRVRHPPMTRSPIPLDTVVETSTRTTSRTERRPL